MVDPGPAEEGRSLNLTFFNPERDSRIGGKGERQKGKKKLHSKKKSVITVILKQRKMVNYSDAQKSVS